MTQPPQPKQAGSVPPVPTLDFWSKMQEKPVGRNGQPYHYIPKRITEHFGLPKGARIHWKCGVGSNGKIVFQIEEIMLPDNPCPKCRHETLTSADYCTNCGEPLNRKESKKKP